MTWADVTGGCSASEGGVPSATAVPALPSEAWVLLGTAQGLPTAALQSRSVAESGVRRQQGCAGGPSLMDGRTSERSLG